MQVLPKHAACILTGSLPLDVFDGWQCLSPVITEIECDITKLFSRWLIVGPVSRRGGHYDSLSTD